MYDIGEFEGQRYIAMEYLEGQPLDRFIGGKPLPLPTMLDLGVQITDAHRAGAHARASCTATSSRPTSSSPSAGTPRCSTSAWPSWPPAARARSALDATAQTVAAQILTTVGMAVGTVAYMSPEQARGEDLDTRSDLFSLGVVLHEMATGRQAFAGPTAAVVFDAILNRMPPPIVSMNPEVPLELERIIDKAIEKDRLLRYQHAADLKSDLAAAEARSRVRACVDWRAQRIALRRAAGGDCQQRRPRRRRAGGATILGRVRARRGARVAAAVPAPWSRQRRCRSRAQAPAKKSNTAAIAAAVVGVLIVGGAALGYVLSRRRSSRRRR